MRSWLLGVALGVGASLLAPGGAPGEPAVVSAIFAGTHQGRLQLEIRGSAPLSYLLVEDRNPFSVSLLLLDATFGFPAQERELPGPGLTKIRTVALERNGSRLGRVDFVFGGRAPYRVVKDGSRLLLRVDLSPPPEGLVLAGPGAAPFLARPVGPAGSPGPRPVSVPLILTLMPEAAEDEVRVLVEADGPLAYRSFTLDGPARVVVDFEEALLSLAGDTVEVGDPLLKRIRSSQYRPTVVRIVLDLTRPNPFHIEGRPEGVVIHLPRGRRR